MADEYIPRTHSPERRLVMPERGSRYSPRRVTPKTMDGVRQVVQKPTPLVSNVQIVAPVTAQPRTVQKQHRKTGSSKPAVARQHKSLVLKRHINSGAEQHQKMVKRQYHQQLKAFLAGTAVAVIVGGAGVTLLLARHQLTPSNTQSPTTATLGVQTGSIGSGEPDERAVTVADIAAYKTDPLSPRILRIPRLGTQARIVSVAPNTNGEPTATSNIHDVGWLNSSARPGELGAVIVNGYIAGTSELGAFNNVPSLVAGDQIEIQLGNGKSIAYIVVQTKTYPADKVDMAEVRAVAKSSTSGLSLLTNSGRFNVRTNEFEARTLVQAIQK